MSTSPKTSPDPLPGDDWETLLTKQVARTVNHYRRASGLTTKMFAEMCNIELRERAKTESPINPTTLNNLFAGKRKSIGLSEIMLFARVLGVPPVALMTPVGIEATSEAWPSGTRSAEMVFDAIVGNERWGSLFDEIAPEISEADGGEYALNRHASAFDTRVAIVERSQRIAQLLLEHGQIKRTLRGRAALFYEPVAAHVNDFDALTTAIRKLASDLRSVRAKLRADDVELEKLDPLLSWVDLVDLDDLTDADVRRLLERGAEEAQKIYTFTVVQSHGTAADSAE